MGGRAAHVSLLSSLLLIYAAMGAVALAQDAQIPDGWMPPLVEISFEPTKNAQIAVWIEDADGNYLKTIALTEATALRGIGNRPGASQMNSGFRWPYGRREGVLPSWALRRAAAKDAALFRRVIFQDRISEGMASRTVNDSTPDNYFCLSFDKDRSAQDALDAVSCATVFSSDKGRFVTQEDVDNGYSEPYEDVTTGKGTMVPLSYYSLYPPRHDIGEMDTSLSLVHPDVKLFADHVRDVMPEIDEVTMATPPEHRVRQILFRADSSWPPGEYRACLEINVEGDYNQYFNAQSYPTPTTPAGGWDSWAMGYGYPFRGQPSVVYCVPFELQDEALDTVGTSEPEGSVGTWNTRASDFGTLRGMDQMTDDPKDSPGKGADRLRVMSSGNRLEVDVRPPLDCESDAPPSAVTNLQVSREKDDLHAHEWVVMEFDAASDDNRVYRYDVRTSTEPITDDNFLRALPAKAGTVQAEELVVPTDVPAGKKISLEVGGLFASQEFYFAVAAFDACAHRSPLATTKFTTPGRTFTTVKPCFVATAAFGTPMADEVNVLRRFRDHYLDTNAVGRAFVAAYYRVGPVMADIIRDRPILRKGVRALLSPLIALARWLEN